MTPRGDAAQRGRYHPEWFNANYVPAQRSAAGRSGAPEFVGREEKRLMPSRHKFDELVQRDEGEVRLAEAALLFALTIVAA